MWAGLILYLRPAGRGATGGSAGPCVVAQFAAPRGHACVRARHGAEEAGTCAASRCPALCARPPSTGRAGRARGVAGASATTKHAQETQKNWLTSIFVSIVLKHTDIRARAKGPLGLGAIPPLKLGVNPTRCVVCAEIRVHCVRVQYRTGSFHYCTVYSNSTGR